MTSYWMLMLRTRMNERAYLLEQLEGMSSAELVDAMFTDPATGLLNRRAFERGMSQMVAIIDLDGLKYINDTEGHDAGDALLRDLAQALTAKFARVYRLAGDEFVIRANSAAEIQFKLRQVRKQFPGFSFGIGRDLREADASMRFEKRWRTGRGDRAERGCAIVGA